MRGGAVSASVIRSRAASASVIRSRAVWASVIRSRAVSARHRRGGTPRRGEKTLLYYSDAR